MALVKVQWKQPGQHAMLDEKDLGSHCSFTDDHKWHRFVETPVSTVPADSDPVTIGKPRRGRPKKN